MPIAASITPQHETGDAEELRRTPLRGEHLAQLHAALLSAYSLSSLEICVKTCFDRDLGVIVPVHGRNLTEIVHDLVRWAADDESVGVQGLLRAAWGENPTNPQMTALHTQWAQIEFETRPPCPYPGMQPFRGEESHYFFGREAEVASAVQRLRLHPFLIVVGASGSGKSSLAFAGIVPAMQRSGFFGGERLEICSFRPGAAPLTALAAALGCGEPAPTAPEEVVACAEHRARTAPILLLVDQFEETYTLAPVEEAAIFQKTLLRLAGLPNLYLLVTARADFYVNLMNSPLWPIIQAHRLEITTLGEDALRAAITLPAQAVGTTVQEGLVERLVADAAGEPGALPFLQETLVLLWDKLQHAELPLAAYTQLAAGQSGRTGLQVAMALRADAALADPRLPAGGQAIARRIFLRLVQFGEGRPNTRRQQAEGDLRAAGEDPAAFDAVLSLLISCRLLSAGGDSQGVGRRIDIAHEALLGGWPALGGWVGERRQAEIERRRLEGKAGEWVRLGRGEAGLLDRVELKEAAAYLDGPDGADLGASADLLALAATSRKAVDPGWNGRGVLALVGGALAVLALLAAGLFYLQTSLLALAARVALLLFWTALVVGLLVLLWLLRRSDPQLLKRWSQSVPLKRAWHTGLGLTVATACVSWLAIGVWALPVEQTCRVAGFSRSPGVDQIAIVGENTPADYAVVFAQVFERVTGNKAEVQAASLATALDCASFLNHVVVLGTLTQTDGEPSFFTDQIDPRSGERSRLLRGYPVTEGCQGLLYLATDTADRFQYVEANLDMALLTAGDPPCAAVLANEQGLTLLNVDYLKARQHFLAALNIWPPYIDARVNWGITYAMDGEWEQAVELFEFALELLPQPSRLVLHHLGLACYYAKRMACAEDATLRALELTTDTEARLRLMNTLFQIHRYTNDWQQAQKHLQQYLVRMADLPEPAQEFEILAAKAQGVLAVEEQRWDDAAGFLAAADRWQGFGWQDWLELGQAWLSGRNEYQARWRDYHEWDEEIVYYLAVTAEQQGQPATACDYWRRYRVTAGAYIYGQAERRAQAEERIAALGCNVQ